MSRTELVIISSNEQLKEVFILITRLTEQDGSESSNTYWHWTYWSGKLADASHFLLYGFMTIIPATGIAMRYYGGKGLWVHFCLMADFQVAEKLISQTIFSGLPSQEQISNGDIAKQVSIYSCSLTKILFTIYNKNNFFMSTILLLQKSFSIHKTLGVYGKYLIPIHIGVVVKHSVTVTGGAIWSRINILLGVLCIDNCNWI